MPDLNSYPVWDVPTRWFHWINVLCVIGLIAIGAWIAEWVAARGIELAALKPYSPHMVDEAAWDSMRAFRKPFITAHYYSFNAIVVMIVVHISAVVVTELKEGGGIVSAMFTGRKVFVGTPEDEPREEG